MTQTSGGSLFRIAVATDIHLGFAEKDPIRGNDSFRSFEECLKTAKDRQVDFLLLGGDLFHENKPSRLSVNRCISLLRRYCLGDRAVPFEFLSDPSVNFAELEFPNVNYEDFNLNVGLPVFSINGNHDDLTGNPPLCALDILHSCGLLNYFGKVTSVEKLVVTPLLLRKGDTNLAIYGIGAIRDERLHQMFLQNHVSFLRPKDDENQERWFNLLVIHQNRVKRGDANYIPESFLPSFIDLVIWGHEHPCEIDPVKSAEKPFYIMQPGSTVATQLAEGEEGDKCMGILAVERTKFKLEEKIKLMSVRQFHLEDITLAATKLRPNTKDTNKHVELFLKSKIDQIIDNCQSERLPTQPEEPLIRLRIDHSGGFESFNPLRFGMKYQGKVANPREMILWTRKKEKTAKFHLDREILHDVLKKTEDESIVIRVEDLVKEYFQRVADENKMLVLSEAGLGEAVKEYVDKDEKDAIEELTKHQMKKSRQTLTINEEEEDENAVTKQLKRMREERAKRYQNADAEEKEESTEFLKTKRAAGPKPKAKYSDDDEEAFDDFEDSVKKPMTNVKTPVNKKQRSGKEIEEVNMYDDSGEEDDFNTYKSKKSSPTATRGRGRGRGSRGGRTASTSTAAGSASKRGRGRPSKCSNGLAPIFGVIPESPVKSHNIKAWASKDRKVATHKDDEVSVESISSDDDWAQSSRRSSPHKKKQKCN